MYGGQNVSGQRQRRRFALGHLRLGHHGPGGRPTSEAGHSLAEITEKIQAMRDQISVFVSVDTLENAVKGGRISRVHATVAQVLRMKILLRTCGGAVEVCGKVRGRKNMLAAFVGAMQSKAVDYRNRIVGISHVGNPTEAEALAKTISERFDPGQIIISPMGSTIATYAGLGAIALSY